MTNRYTHLEGLRAYLAIWVAVGHGLQTSGYLEGGGLVKFLLMGDQAVHMFVILSGFVITHLLLRGQESYPTYITRRFFRLYPAYVVACVIGFFMLPYWAELGDKVRWADDPGWASYASGVKEIASQSWDNTLPHALLHAVMLHGTVPTEILPRASMTFLPAAWSISLEWQFYLIAPLVLAAAMSANAWRAIVTFALLVVAYALYSKGKMGTWVLPAFIIAGAPYFAVGIISRLIGDKVAGLQIHPLALSAIAALLIISFAPGQYALLLWIPIFLFLHSGRTDWSTKAFDWIFANPVARWVGEGSYSLYLIHRPVQVVMATLAISYVPNIQKPLMLAVQLAAVVLAVPVALLMWKLIEKPGMALGRRLASR